MQISLLLLQNVYVKHVCDYEEKASPAQNTQCCRACQFYDTPQISRATCSMEPQRREAFRIQRDFNAFLPLRTTRAIAA
jgi:hypothetical protein